MAIEQDTKKILKKFSLKSLSFLKGFTLIELIMVIIIVSVMAGIGTRFIDFPVKAYMDVVNRQEIVNAADLVFTKIARELRQALPNSVRVKPGNSKAIEFLNVKRGYRYRRFGPGSAADKLEIRQFDDSFNVLGLFPSDMLGSQGYRIVVYNLGSEGTNSDDPLDGINAYSNQLTGSGGGTSPGSSVITSASNVATLSNIGDEGRVSLSSAHKFPFRSQAQRVYFVDTPVSFICDTTAKTITKYENYSINPTQPSNPAVSPLSGATATLVAKNISDCKFTYDRNVTASSGVVKIEIEFDSDGKKIRVFDQVRVSNVP